MAVILDGKLLAQKTKQALSERAAALKGRGITPCLAVVLVGADPASAVYVRNKIKDCEEVGIKSLPFYLPEETQEEELISLVKSLNEDETVHGILVQFPVPRQIREKNVCAVISPKKDVDGFHIENLGKLAAGEDCFLSCTPAGAMRLIESAGQPIEGKTAVVIGRSNNVGKPMALLLLEKNATVTVCHSRTKDLASHVRGADIVVSAVGRAGMVTADMVKPGAVVIDVGISVVEGKIKGDVDFPSVSQVAGFITPMPGGTGPMTRALLMENTVKACEAWHPEL